jgi:hypothetical protein
MIVRCLSFGTAWWLRPYLDPKTGQIIRQQSTFMNTTGFRRGKRVVWGHKTAGFVRLNAATHPSLTDPAELLQSNFKISGIESFRNSNRILLGKRVASGAPCDAYLVTLTSEEYGQIDFTSDWRSPKVRIVSSSFNSTGHSNQQETMLLVPNLGTIKSSLGEWGIIWNSRIAYLGMI